MEDHGSTKEDTVKVEEGVRYKAPVQKTWMGVIVCVCVGECERACYLKCVQARILTLINSACINRRPEKTEFQTAEWCSLVKQLNGAA